MKKKLCIVLLSLGSILYLSFLFVMPNVINLNNYKVPLFTFLNEQTKLEISADNLKLYTTPALKIGVKTDNLKISYSDKKVLTSTKNADIRLNLIPILWKKLQLDFVSVDEPVFNDVLQKNGSTKFEEFLNNFFEKQNNIKNEVEDDNAFPLIFSSKLPKIKITNYNLNLFDVLNKQNLIVNGNELFMSGNLDKNIVIKTVGTFNVNERKIIGYKFNIDTIIPTTTQKKEDKKTQKNNFDLTPISKIVSKKFHSDIDIDLKIREKNKKNVVEGFANISNLEFLVKNQIIKDNKIEVNFLHDKISFNSDFNFSNKEKISAMTSINTDKKFVDVNIKTQKLDISNIFDACISLLDIANVETNLKDFKLSGILKSNLNIRTDMKKVVANGTLTLENGNISDKRNLVRIASTNGVIEATNGDVNINANTLINNSKINLQGKIDKNTNTKLSVESDVIHLNSLLESFAPAGIRNLYSVKSGTLLINFSTSGKLKKLTHNLKLDLAKLNLYDKNNKITLLTDKINSSLKTDLKTYTGKVQIFSASANIPQFVTIKLPKAEIIFDDKDITLKNSFAYLNDSVINFDGKISDYIKKLKIDVNADGNIKTTDLKKMLPKKYWSYISTAGILPIIAKISGNSKTLCLQAQTLASNTNHFSVLNINELKKQNSIANIKISTDYKALNFDDISLSIVNTSNLDKSDYKKNLNNSTKLAGVTGEISDIFTKAPIIQNIDVLIPATLNSTLPVFEKSNFAVNGKLSFSGNFNNLKLNGFLSVPKCSIPEISASAENLDLSFNNNSLTVHGERINLNDSIFEGTFDIKSIFDKIITIQTMKVKSSNFDADKLFVFIDKLYKAIPQSSSNGPKASVSVVPLKIINGSGTIEKFIMKPLKINDITGHFSLANDIFKLDNLKMLAYKGNVTGNLNYNLKKLSANCNFKGNNLNVNQFVTDFTGLKDQLTGAGDFKANISFSGSDYKTQMKTLKGLVDFTVEDGQLGTWGRFENYINAPNLKNINNFTNELNKITTTLSPKQSGAFDNMTGHIILSNGYADLSPVKSTGKMMSLYLSGKFNLLNNDLQLLVLGNVAEELASVLGSLSVLYPSNIITKAQNIGNAASSLMGIYTQIADKQTLAKIPALSVHNKGSSAFIVKIDGNIAKPTQAVKSFRWLSTSADYKTAKDALLKIFVKTETVKPKAETSTLKNVGSDILKSVYTQTQPTTDKINKDAADIQQKTQQAAENFKNKSTEEKVQSVFEIINKLNSQKQGFQKNETTGN